MYKKIGCEFTDMKGDSLKCFFFVKEIESFYQSSGKSNLIEYNERRKHSRINIDNTLPEEFSISIWIMYENRWRKTVIKDVSENGACFLLPFDDRHNVFTRNRPISILIDLNKDWWGDPTICKSTVKHDAAISVDTKAKLALSKLYKTVHEIDKEFLPITTARRFSR